MGGWEDGWVGGGWAAEGGLRLPLKHSQPYAHTVRLVSDTNSLNPQNRSRQSLATVWHHSDHTHPY